jgi:hypothetical protein
VVECFLWLFSSYKPTPLREKNSIGGWPVVGNCPGNHIQLAGKPYGWELIDNMRQSFRSKWIVGKYKMTLANEIVESSLK